MKAIERKYLVLIGDGMADYPIDSLGGRTPLEFAGTPNMDLLAARGILGLAEDAGRMVLTDPERYSPERYRGFVHWVMKLLWPS